MKPRIVVTGAAGFIGRNLVAALNARGRRELLLVDQLGTDEKWRNLVGLHFDQLLSPADFRARLRADVLPAIETVFHLGACSATTERDADYLYDNNTRYTRELCEWCLAHQVRFIYASSAATYGDGALGYSDRDETTVRLRPLNMYGLSKHLFDLWALEQGLFDRIVGLKYFNVYGPFEDHKGDMRSVVHKSYRQIAAGQDISLFRSCRPDYADGEQRRDFIYVRDAVAVTLHFAEHREASGLFNCGTGRSRTWLDLARAVYAAVGREPRIGFIDMPEALRAKYQYFTEADLTKLRAAGYRQPFHSLEDGIRDYVRSHLALPA
jgi:ADP-L-glycero-D-manno-heptose 6-epimerase